MRIEMSHSQIFLRDDGVVQVNTTDHNYTVKDLKELNSAQGKISNGKKLPLLVITTHYANIESDAREFMASAESTQYSTAEAYVIIGLGQKILANFYMKVNKPGVSTRFFTDLKLAEEWLLSYLPSDL